MQIVITIIVATSVSIRKILQITVSNKVFFLSVQLRAAVTKNRPCIFHEENLSEQFFTRVADLESKFD